MSLPKLVAILAAATSLAMAGHAVFCAICARAALRERDRGAARLAALVGLVSAAVSAILARCAWGLWP